MNNNTPVYSYHTFLYPFLYLDEAQEGEFAGLFERSPHWKPDNQNAEQAESRGLQERLAYQSFQYFNVSARRALFGEEGTIVRCFCFQPKGQALEGTYEIEPPANAFTKQRQEPIALRLNAIRLKIYNTGVAVMVYETEYRPDPTISPAQRRANVKHINEYGRRLYPEYLPAAPFPVKFDSSMLCAENIILHLFLKVQVQTEKGIKQEIGEEIIRDNFRKRAEHHLSSRKEDRAQSYVKNPVFLPNLVGKILNYGWDQERVHCRNSDAAEEGMFRIEPAIDDRMFVCCCIRDSAYVEELVGYPTSSSGYQAAYPVEPKNQYLKQRQAHEWKFRTDWLTGQEMYALINVDDNVSDPEGSSCQNREALDRYLDEQLYLRWIEYGTIHAVTNHSMFCLTSEDISVDHIPNSFLTLYTQMCILTVVQRASLLAFDARITKCVSPAQGRKILDRDTRKHLYDIAEDFAVFQGQILISEVTPQIQGIELYEKLQKMLFIDALERNVQQQLNNLFQIARSRQEDEQLKQDEEQNRHERRQDLGFSWLALLFAGITIPSFCIDLFQYLGELFNWSYLRWVPAAFIPLIGIVVGIIIARFVKKDGQEREDTNEP